jgi:hypothetical protein
VRPVAFVSASGSCCRVAQDELVVIPDGSGSGLTCVWWVVGFGSVELESWTKSKSTRCLASLLSVGLRSHCRAGRKRFNKEEGQLSSALRFVVVIVRECQLSGLNLSPKLILPRIHRPLPFLDDKPGITREASRQGTGIHGKYLLSSTFSLVPRAIPHCHSCPCANFEVRNNNAPA